MSTNPSDTTPSSRPDTRRYRAFLSYRHADNQQEGRRWAEWLHRELERYEIPPDLIGTQNQRREPVPGSLYPIFRDEEELPAHPDIAAAVRHGLEHSDFMVVLCSPRSAVSKWVRDEIREFKQKGKSDRILAVILAGEPNATDPKKASDGIAPDEECFPHELRYGVAFPDKRDAAGNPVIDWTARTEPHAADFRPRASRSEGFITAADYKRHLTLVSGYDAAQIGKFTKDYSERIEQARLKIISGILGISPALLRDRDAIYRAKQAEKRNRILIGVITVVCILAALAGWYWLQASLQNKAREAALVRGGDIALTNSKRYWSNAEWTSAIRSLLDAIDLQPDNPEIPSLLWHALAAGGRDHRNLPDRALALPENREFESFHPTLPLALLWKDRQTLELWSRGSKWKNLASIDDAKGTQQVEWSPDGKMLMTLSFAETRVYELKDGRPVLIGVLKVEPPRPNAFRFVPPHRVFSVSDGKLLEWDVEKRSFTVKPITLPKDTVPVAFHPLRPIVLLGPHITIKPGLEPSPPNSVMLHLDGSGKSDSLGFPAADAAFSKDGRVLYALRYDKGWQHAGSRLLVCTLDSPKFPVTSFDNWERIKSFGLSPDNRTLLCEFSDERIEAVSATDGLPLLVWPKGDFKRVFPAGFDPLSNEVVVRYSYPEPRRKLPLAFYKLPSLHSAFAGTGRIHYLQAAAWTSDKSKLVVVSAGDTGTKCYSWPSLKPTGDPPANVRQLTYTSVGTDMFERLLASGRLDITQVPPFPGEFPQLSIESGDGRFRLEYLGEGAAAIDYGSLAAVPIVQIHPPGDIRRFIEPLLDWYQDPNQVPTLIALCDQLHAELLDPTKSTYLPQEWRDLLLWWTTKPGERKPLYQ